MNAATVGVSFFGLLQLVLFLYSFRKVRNSGQHITFINPWGFPFGAFIYEDLLVLSVFHFCITLFSLLMRDIRIGVLGYCVFWIVRGSGETIYYFLQQMHVPKHYPHDITDYLGILKFFTGTISYQKSLILIQVITQVIVMMFLFFTILLLKFWETIPSGF